MLSNWIGALDVEIEVAIGPKTLTNLIAISSTS